MSQEDQEMEEYGEEELTHQPNALSEDEEELSHYQQQQIEQRRRVQQQQQQQQRTKYEPDEDCDQDDEEGEPGDQQYNMDVVHQTGQINEDDDEEEEQSAMSKATSNGHGANNKSKKLSKINNIIKVNQSPAPSPPKPIKRMQKNELDEIENSFRCVITNIPEFKWCLDSVKFPHGNKKYIDVLFQAMIGGITLKSHSYSGEIMTKCCLKSEFFGKNQFVLEINNPEDKARNYNLKQNNKLPLIEFCLPFNELKQIVDGMVDEKNTIHLRFPVGDSKLEIKIPETIGNTMDSSNNRIIQETTLMLDAYRADHNLKEVELNIDQVCAQVFGKIIHFKRALKEFSFAPDSTYVEIKFSDQYPNISMRLLGDNFQDRNHVIKFNSQIENLVYKKLSNCSSAYTLGALRLGFSRISNDNLICIVSMFNDGNLSLRHMDDDMQLMIESIIQPYDQQNLEDEDD
ncbi:UNKNOWN [Stylonychia lemnae]|uniref:Uncharacterized protein n=1 Tax=Stylonychia lemnae TaxID=5949 RepID=A0A078A0K2_STYLE|nr:UNKNOWN [Stylonychia lemnae]|eukprot:CDW75731.1 UNKNOWN [Stylonychia lemnae]